jgi:membrane protease YdiL (CAAX protease family)
MKPENNLSRAFIDLAKMGRTDWRSVALTILLVKFLSILFFVISIVSVIAVAPPTFFRHPLFLILDADKIDIFGGLGAAASIFGFWLACKKVLRRPFRSLISADMTFEVRRCFLGAALYLPANAVSLMAMSLFFSMRAGAWGAPIRHFEWPHHNDQTVALMGKLIVIPFLAFAEELFFRAWLTQTLGHYIRSTIIVVALVAVLFAAYHTQYNFEGKVLVMLCSLGFSALSLRDQRLEIAIGAHSMMNVCVTLQLLFFTGSLPHVQNPLTTLDWWIIVILKGALPYALMYGLLQKMRRWFVPADAHLANSGGVQLGHL